MWACPTALPPADTGVLGESGNALIRELKVQLPGQCPMPFAVSNLTVQSATAVVTSDAPKLYRPVARADRRRRHRAVALAVSVVSWCLSRRSLLQRHPRAPPLRRQGDDSCTLLPAFAWHGTRLAFAVGVSDGAVVCFSVRAADDGPASTRRLPLPVAMREAYESAALHPAASGPLPERADVEPQPAVTCLAWCPFALGTLAVGKAYVPRVAVAG